MAVLILPPGGPHFRQSWFTGDDLDCLRRKDGGLGQGRWRGSASRIRVRVSTLLSNPGLPVDADSTVLEGDGDMTVAAWHVSDPSWVAYIVEASIFEETGQ